MRITKCDYICINKHSWTGKRCHCDEFFELLTAWDETCPICGAIAEVMADYDEEGNRIGGCVLTK